MSNQEQAIAATNMDAGTTGLDGRGVARPSGISGVMGSVKRARHMMAGQVEHTGWAGKYNGSLSRAGQRISIKVGCGSPGARAA